MTRKGLKFFKYNLTATVCKISCFVFEFSKNMLINAISSTWSIKNSNSEFLKFKDLKKVLTSVQYSLWCFYTRKLIFDKFCRVDPLQSSIGVFSITFTNFYFLLKVKYEIIWYKFGFFKVLLHKLTYHGIEFLCPDSSLLKFRIFMIRIKEMRPAIFAHRKFGKSISSIWTFSCLKFQKFI